MHLRLWSTRELTGSRLSANSPFVMSNFDDIGLAVISEDSVSWPLLSTPATNKRVFHESFESLLQNPKFLEDGGTLTFGPRHVYPIDSLEHLYGVLKGSGAVVYQTT